MPDLICGKTAAGGNYNSMYDKILTENDVWECFQEDSLINNMKQTVSKAEKKYLFCGLLLF